MPSNRFDDDMPKIYLDKEDREAFQQTRGKGKYSSTEPEPPEKASEAKNKPTGNASPVWTTILLVLILGGFGSSFWLYQQQLQLTQTLDSAQNRIVDLENRLSATGEEMGDSAAAIQVKVTELDAKSKELWEQMDKLWASAWRRNQSDIKDIAKRLDTLNSDNTDVEKQIKLLQTDINASLTNFDLLQEQLNLEKQNLVKLTGSTQGYLATQSSQTKRLDELNRKSVAADKISSTLLQRITELEKWQQSESTKSKSKPKPTKVEQEPPKKEIPPPLTVG